MRKIDAIDRAYITHQELVGWCGAGLMLAGTITLVLGIVWLLQERGTWKKSWKTAAFWPLSFGGMIQMIIGFGVAYASGIGSLFTPAGIHEDRSATQILAAELSAVQTEITVNLVILVVGLTVLILSLRKLPRSRQAPSGSEKASEETIGEWTLFSTRRGVLMGLAIQMGVLSVFQAAWLSSAAFYLLQLRDIL